MFVNAAFGEGLTPPFVAVAGSDFRLHLVSVDEGEVHSDDAVTAVDARQGLFVVASLGVFGAVPVVAAAGFHVELGVFDGVDVEQVTVFGVAAAVGRLSLECQGDAAVGEVLLAG